MLRRLLMASVLWGAPCRPGFAQALPPDLNLEISERALELGRAGLESFQRGDWARALEAFEQAESTAHSPVFVLYIARCYVERGQLVAAKAVYEVLLEEQIVAGAPRPWHEALEQATDELRALSLRIPTVLVEVSGADGHAVATWIDGVALDAHALGSPLELDPGPHTFFARTKTSEALEQLVLAENERRRTVRLRLVSRDVAPAPGLEVAPQPRPEAVLPTDTNTRTPAILAFGVGAALASVGATTGLVAWKRANEIKENCDGVHCSPEDERRGDTAETLGDLSTISFIAAGVAATVGVVLFTWPREDDSRVELRAGDRRVSLRLGF